MSYIYVFWGRFLPGGASFFCAPFLTPKTHICPVRGAFGDSYTYPAYFLGLGRGLDFLLPSFLSSRKEKKVGE